MRDHRTHGGVVVEQRGAHWTGREEGRAVVLLDRCLALRGDCPDPSNALRRLADSRFTAPSSVEETAVDQPLSLQARKPPLELAKAPARAEDLPKLRREVRARPDERQQDFAIELAQQCDHRLIPRRYRSVAAPAPRPD